jgi:deferrochelatase/peroxidase EfeB
MSSLVLSTTLPNPRTLTGRRRQKSGVVSSSSGFRVGPPARPPLNSLRLVESMVNPRTKNTVRGNQDSVAFGRRESESLQKHRN